MTVPTPEQLRVVWAGAGDHRRGAGQRLHRTAVRLLADGAPVEAAAIAEVAARPVAEVRGWLRGLEPAGYELDTAGRLVGAALTLRPTPYRFRVRGNDLYTWCGFDALFLPVLLHEPAGVAATCPVTRQPIRLEVAADATVTAATPATTVVAIVGPAITSTCETTGPSSEVCRQMPFLADREAGDAWLASHPGVAVVDLDAASELARAYLGGTVADEA